MIDGMTRSWAFLVFAPVAGCLFPDVGGLTGGAIDSGNDVVVVMDASAEAEAEAGVEASVPFCTQSSHTFCADFDEGDVLLGWSSNQVDTDGTLGLSTSNALSSPAAAHMTMARRGSSAPTENATISKGFAAWQRIVTDVDVYLVAPAWQQGDVNSGFFTMGFYSSATSDAMALSIGANYVTVGAPGGVSSNGTTFPTDQWVHVHVDVDPAGTFSMTIGTQSFQKTFPAMDGTGSPHMYVNLGISGYNEPAPAFDVSYDNVTIDLL